MQCVDFKSLCRTQPMLPEQALAFCMGMHARLGAGSKAGGLPDEILKQICTSLVHMYLQRIRKENVLGSVRLHQSRTAVNGPGLSWMRKNGLVHGKFTNVFVTSMVMEQHGIFAQGEEYVLSNHTRDRKRSFLLFTYHPRREGMLQYVAGILRTITNYGTDRILFRGRYECEIGHSIVLRHTANDSKSPMQIFFFGEKCCGSGAWDYNCSESFADQNRRNFNSNNYKRFCCRACQDRHTGACNKFNQDRGNHKKFCVCFSAKSIVLASSSFREGGRFGHRNVIKNGFKVKRQVQYDYAASFELLVI